MKKFAHFIILTLAATLCLSLASCNGSNTNGETTSSSNGSSIATQDTCDPLDEYTEGLVFELNDDGSTYSVTGYTGKAKTVVIPQNYEGCPVTSIGDSAFYKNTSITSITIPDSITSIGDLAFYGCDSLTGNTYGNALYLGNESNKFLVLLKTKNTSMISLSIHPDTKIIADYAFMNCNLLISMTIPEGVTSIGCGAFINCKALTRVTIPEGITSIRMGTFNSCQSLTSITIPDSVTSIAETSFFGCTSLTNVFIPDGVTFIGPGAFGECSTLKSVTIPSTVTSIRFSAFGACPSLTSITYNGTEEQWNAITKEFGWDSGSSSYTVHYTDSDIK